MRARRAFRHIVDGRQRLPGKGVALAGAIFSLFCACAADTPSPDQIQSALPLAGGTTDVDTKAVFSLRVRLGVAGTRQCTATLIAPNLLLTARHCLVAGLELPNCGDDFPELVEARAIDLTHATRLDSEEAAEIPVVQGASILVPEEDVPCGADLALVVTDELFDIAPIAPRLEPPVQAGERYSAVGYGMLGELSGGEGTRRRLDDLEVQCAGSTCGSTVTSREFLGSDGPCEGDSGGPSLARGELTGVLSRGTSGCTHAVYIAVEPWADFLRSSAQLAASTGGYEAPAWTMVQAEPEPEEPLGSAGAAGAPAMTTPDAPEELANGRPSAMPRSEGCTVTRPLPTQLYPFAYAAIIVLVAGMRWGRRGVSSSFGS